MNRGAVISEETTLIKIEILHHRMIKVIAHKIFEMISF